MLPHKATTLVPGARPHVSIRGQHRGATGPADRVSSQSCRYLHLWRCRGWRKTVGVILEPLRYATRVANYTAGFFRRSTPQITNPGGLWDESQNFYPRLGGIPHVGMREWRWPRAGRIKFSHLEFDSTVYVWQGAQIALICFDELTHFTAHQFFYLVSRNRSTAACAPTFAPPATPTPTAGSPTSWRGDRPAERAGNPRAGRCAALLRPRRGEDHLARPARGIDATALST